MGISLLQSKLLIMLEGGKVSHITVIIVSLKLRKSPIPNLVSGAFYGQLKAKTFLCTRSRKTNNKHYHLSVTLSPCFLSVSLELLKVSYVRLKSGMGTTSISIGHQE